MGNPQTVSLNLHGATRVCILRNVQYRSLQNIPLDITKPLVHRVYTEPRPKCFSVHRHWATVFRTSSPLVSDLVFSHCRRTARQTVNFQTSLAIKFFHTLCPPNALGREVFPSADESSGDERVRHAGDTVPSVCRGIIAVQCFTALGPEIATHYI